MKKLGSKADLFIAAIVLLLCFLLGFLKVHGSSIPVLGNIMTQPNQKIIFGIPRHIRSDEWLVNTLFMHSQVKNNFNRINELIGDGQALSITTDAPVRGIEGYFSPFNSFFFIIDDYEIAFSLRWWFRYAFLLLSIYFFLRKIIKISEYQSLSASFIFVLSPFIQWWDLTEIVAYPFLITTIVISLLNCDFSLSRKFLYGVLLSYTIIAFSFVLYPPFQLTLALLFAFFIVSYLLKNKHLINYQNSVVILFSLLLSFSCITLFIHENMEAFSLMRNTSYPGERIVSGGNYSVNDFLLYFYSIQLQDDIKVLGFKYNQSAGSGFFLFSPFLITIFLINIKKIKKDDFFYFFVSLMLFNIMCCFWMLLGLPSLVAKFFMLNFIPEKRILLGLGIADILLALIYVVKLKIPFTKMNSLIILLFSLSFFVILLIYGIDLKKTYPLFIQSNLKIFIISFVPALILLFLMFKRIKFYIFTMLFFTLASTYKVRPYSVGLEIIEDNTFIQKVKEIKPDREKKWVVYDNIIIGNLLAANGFKTLSGIYVYPNHNLLNKFDVEGKYKNVWNRYSHTTFTDQPDKDSFILIQSDSYHINISPCSETLQKVNVSYYVFTNKVEYECLEQIAFDQISNSYIYSIKSSLSSE